MNFIHQLSRNTILFLVLALFMPSILYSQLTITANNYDINCHHPNALDEFYTNTTVYQPPFGFPTNIPSSGLGLVQNTYIPFNVDCGALGEIIQEIDIEFSLAHNDFSDIALVLHAPSAMNLSPDTLASFGQLATSNNFSASTDFNSVIGTSMVDTESTVYQSNYITTQGNLSTYFFGNTWHLQLIDNNDPITNPAYGGSIINAASISITSEFPFPYTVSGTGLQSVNLIQEQLVETNCNTFTGYGTTIERVWEATDNNNQTTSALQVVGLKFPNFFFLEFPNDIDIECGGSYPTESDSGAPSFGCFEINNSLNSECDVSMNYTDIVFPTCGNSYIIQREWLVINWCTGSSETHNQIIRVLDTTAPSVNHNLTFTIANCSESIDLAMLFNDDACSGIMSATAIFEANGGTYNPNSASLQSLDLLNSSLVTFPPGNHEAYLNLQDSCLNTDTRLITFSVQSSVPCCPTNLVILDNPIPNGMYAAEETLNSSGLVPNTGNVIFQANDNICLNLGFEVEQGGTFEVKIEGCANPLPVPNN